MIRWLSYGLMTASLAAAVLLSGGVVASQWKWSALGIAIAAALALFGTPRDKRARGGRRGLLLLTLLLAWMLFQLLPLPPALVQWLSPARWNAVAAARAASGYDPHSWVALSVAPSLTFERLLFVIPAMAVFVTAREMSWWWRDQVWIAVAPVIGIAWLESTLGLVQFYFSRADSGQGGTATGTYVNHNHFAGLVEICLPVALMWMIARLRKSTPDRTMTSALGTAILFAISTCLLMGVVVSLSRMAFISTSIAMGVITLIWLGSWVSRNPNSHRLLRWGLWIVPFVVPLLILVILTPRELVRRFADFSTPENVTVEGRTEIWRETMQAALAYRWTGCGLGAYETGLFQFKNFAPLNRIDFAHNDYLQILAEVGIPGVLLAGAFTVWFVSRMFSVILWRRSSNGWELAVGVLGAAAALGMHSMADFNFYIPANAMAFAWLCGAAERAGVKEPPRAR
jgi:O-antigen ligase